MGDIKSNQLKDIPFPEDFTDEDKENYMNLFNVAKVEHADIYEKEKWIIHYGIIMYIKSEKGQKEPFTNEELKKIAEKFQNADWVKNKEVKCNGDENSYLYDKDNNPMFKDDSYFFKNNEEGNIAETSAEDKVVITLT